MTSKNTYYVGVDVGTKSVRASLVSSDGEIVRSRSIPIDIWDPSPGFYEQSSNNIWHSCIEVVKSVTEGTPKTDIKGIGFDATCSLVVLDKNFQPVSVNESGCLERNIILWMDHRALEEAKHISNLSHPLLKYLGGKMSPEMQPPKMLWLKKNLPAQWSNIQHIFDLPDFLTWKATGSLSRSLCSLVCKFLYQPKEDCGWDESFWKQLELEEVISGKIGHQVLAPGQLCGSGLTDEAAEELGLLSNTPVSVSVIDCYAGVIGALGCCAPGKTFHSLDHRLVLISGTSACHVKVHEDPKMTPGVWGPYYSALLPHMYCVEAGQSAAGSLIDFVIDTHPAAAYFKEFVVNRHITEILNDLAEKLAFKHKLQSLSYLTYDVHVYPDYHGNRSPLADPDLSGMLLGLTLSSDSEDLVKKYVATLQALAYSTRYIISCLKESGHTIETLVICGGLALNSLYVQMHADITGLPVIVPDVPEPVLLGAAILGATAAGDFPDLISAMKKMCGVGKLVEPCLADIDYHERKYKSFLMLLQCQKEIRAAMHV